MNELILNGILLINENRSFNTFTDKQIKTEELKWKWAGYVASLQDQIWTAIGVPNFMGHRGKEKRVAQYQDARMTYIETVKMATNYKVEPNGKTWRRPSPV